MAVHPECIYEHNASLYCGDCITRFHPDDFTEVEEPERVMQGTVCNGCGQDLHDLHDQAIQKWPKSYPPREPSTAS